MRSVLRWIDEGSPVDGFPEPSAALHEPNGLLAVGGDLAPARLLAGYRRGIFPWYGPGQPILWWCPNPRAVFYPEAMHVSRRLGRVIRQGRFRLTADAAFEAVVEGCAGPRRGQEGTWITPEMKAAYGELHRLGHAHSLECWRGEELAGGIYGVAVGAVFFGESMFSRVADASKVALVAVARMGFRLIDCQVPNPHLARLGAQLVPRDRFLAHLASWCRDDASVPFRVPVEPAS